MSQHIVLCDGGGELVVGWDRPFGTFFAQLWEPGSTADDPLRTVGYHPTEQALSPGAEHGPYPVRTRAELFRLLGSWGLSPADLEEARTVITEPDL